MTIDINAPIIVGGFYRSGTSLVRRLLDSHSNIHCGPEIKFFKDFEQDYINDSLGHVRFFSTLPSLGLDRNEILRIFGNAFVTAHELAAQKAKKKRWADKNPENVLHLNDWDTLLPNGFFFVHVVRDPIDALASLNAIGFRKTVPQSFAKKVLLYKTFNEAGTTFAENNPGRSITIRYETLVNQPDDTVKTLFEFLGERAEPDVFKRYYLTERGFGIEDPNVRKTKTIHAKSVGRGKKELTRAQIRIVETLLNTRFQMPGPFFQNFPSFRNFFRSISKHFMDPK